MSQLQHHIRLAPTIRATSLPILSLFEERRFTASYTIVDLWVEFIKEP